MVISHCYKSDPVYLEGQYKIHSQSKVVIKASPLISTRKKSYMTADQSCPEDLSNSYFRIHPPTFWLDRMRPDILPGLKARVEWVAE